MGKRSRLVAIFFQFHLKTSGMKNDRLVKLDSEEVFISKQHAMKIMIKWFQYKSISDSCRINERAKVTNHELNLLNRAVYHKRDLTARKLKNIFNLYI